MRLLAALFAALAVLLATGIAPPDNDTRYAVATADVTEGPIVMAPGAYLPPPGILIGDPV